MRKEIEKLILNITLYGNDCTSWVYYTISDELWEALKEERHEDEDLWRYKDLLKVLRRL